LIKGQPNNRWPHIKEVDMTIKHLKSKPRLALLGASGILAAGAIAGTTAVSQAATPSPAASAAAPAAPEATETPGTEAAEAPEANEPALPGGGHADTGGAVDHQFEGVE
jgi:hypothetical protein